MLKPKTLLATSAIFVVSTFAATSAHAVSVYGTDASGELVGSRDVAGGGLTGFNAYDNGVFTVSWVITLGATVHYEYTFTGLTSADISNVVFDISDDCDVDPFCVTNATITNVLPDPSGAAAVDFGDFSGVTGGVKLEGIDGAESVVYSFDSNRLPVYGHLAVKDGGGPETCMAPGGSNIVCSNQLLGIGSDEDILNFVVRPNGPVPEPTTGALIGFGLVALVASTRRR